MVDVGHLVLILALVCAGYSILISLVGVRNQRIDQIRSGENAALAVTALLTLVVLLLWQQILAHDFHNEYVANYSNRAMPTFYVLSSLWGGQKGSLLFWGWLLSLYSGLVIYLNRDKNRALMPYVVATLMLAAGFFLLLNVFVSQPFEKLWLLTNGSVVSDITKPLGAVAFSPPDGRGLNPLLQHPAMAIHPPVLYLGFVGFAVPFAFAIASLLTGRLDSQWLHTIRRWTIVPWFFLGIGMLLGGKWAYMELGWGGYWAWDPVENAALMPWLAGTAFIHSVMIQEKKNMLRVWNMVLILMTYTFCIFGTFITRSGVISSVHSFARSNIAPWFVAYLVLLVVGSAGLLIWRRDALKARQNFDSVISRESAFLVNNLIFLGALFAVLWGTVFPMVTEAIRGVKVTVAAPWFNTVMTPIGLFLLFLTGVGPLVAWRKTSGKLLRKIFMKPILVSLIAFAALFAGGIRHTYALISLTLAVFVSATIVAEFHRGARARMHNSDEGYFEALRQLFLRNKRRYGGYIVHFGMVVMFIGFTGKAFDAEKESHLNIGESMKIRAYELKYVDSSSREDPNKAIWQTEMEVYKNGEKVKTIYPVKYFYKAQQQPTTEVVLRSTLLEDLYVVLGQPNEDGSAVFKVYLNPLVNLVWLSGMIVTIGTLITLWPDKTGEERRRKRRKKTERQLETA